MIVLSAAFHCPTGTADIKRVKSLTARVPSPSDWLSLHVSPPWPLTRIPGDNTNPQICPVRAPKMNRIAGDRWLLDAAREILHGLLVTSWLRSYRWDLWSWSTRPAQNLYLGILFRMSGDFKICCLLLLGTLGKQSSTSGKR